MPETSEAQRSQQTRSLVNCTNAEVAGLVQRWLDDSRLDWPGELTFDVQVVDAVTPSGDMRERLTQPGIEIQAGPLDGTVRIRWLDREAEALVDANEPRVVLQMTPSAVEQFEMAERGFLLVALLFALRRLGWYHVHCAALHDPLGRGWLFIGQSQSGKSTTTALLGANGWSICTDDIAFLTRPTDRAKLHGFWSPVALRSGGQQLLGANGGLDFSRRGKMGFRPEDLGGNWSPVVAPEILIFPTVGSRTTVEPINARAAMNALIESSIWVLFESMHAQEHLDAMSRLVSQSRAYRATVGPDLFENPNLLLELVDD